MLEVAEKRNKVSVNQSDPLAQELWAKCLARLKTIIPEQEFKNFFLPLRAKSFVGKHLSIFVPSQFFYDKLESDYIDQIAETIEAVIGPDATLEYAIVVDSGDGLSQPLSMVLPGNTTNRHPAVGKPQTTQQEAFSPFYGSALPDSFLHDSNLNSSYTFDNFIEGDYNQFARRFGINISKNPGSTNPFFVYGGVGLGKTHLVQAIGNSIKENFPNLFVLYVSCERFLNQFLDSVSTGKIQQFNKFYNQVDVLILDDVQILKEKEKTQEILFDIFNNLHQRKKQIILTSDCAPKDLKGMHERLKSRFGAGLTVDFLRPDLETRVAIIQHKLQKDGIIIPTEYMEFLARKVDTNLRELEGVIISLVARTTVFNTEVTLDSIKDVIKDIVTDVDDDLTVPSIISMVAEYFKVSEEKIQSPSRLKDIMLPRQVAMYLAKEYTEQSLKYIGEFFGGKDHTTVMHSIRKIKESVKDDAQLKRALEDLGNKLRTKQH